MTVQSLSHKDDIRHNWTHEEITALMDQPFNDLVFTAASMHRKYFDPNEVQVSTLLSIKTGACPEDCKYCSQSAHYNTEIEKEPLIDLDEVIEEARKAKEAGSSRFCMGAAWRQLHDRDVPKVQEMIKTVKDMGMETCVTLGMAKKDQLVKLKEAGLDFYNHNVDTSEEFYGEIITTRNYQDRLDTLQSIADVGLNTCSGGIIGLGESKEDRIGMLQTLANLPTHPKSVPINLLVPIKGTPLADVESVDVFDFVRMIAIARIMMPASYVRLSAGRESLNDEAQSLCFLAGANSIFYGEKLLTASNPKENEDMELFSRLNLRTQTPSCRQELKKQQHA